MLKEKQECWSWGKAVLSEPCRLHTFPEIICYPAFVLLLFYITLSDVVVKLREQVFHDDDRYQIIVRRAHVLEDALHRIQRPSFNPRRPIAVCLIIVVYYTSNVSQSLSVLRTIIIATLNCAG